MIYPKSLIYFSSIIFDAGLVEEAAGITDCAEAMFEIMLGYALVFSSSEDYDLCLDLLKQAIFILDAIKSNLDHEPDLTNLFNNKLF